MISATENSFHEHDLQGPSSMSELRRSLLSLFCLIFGQPSGYCYTIDRAFDAVLVTRQNWQLEKHGQLGGAIEKMKWADRPDSVQSSPFARTDCGHHSSGPLIAERLNATYPHTPRARSSCAYLVLLRVEIARFTRNQSARLCCSDPHLTVDSR